MSIQEDEWNRVCGAYFHSQRKPEKKGRKIKKLFAKKTKTKMGENKKKWKQNCGSFQEDEWDRVVKGGSR